MKSGKGAKKGQGGRGRRGGATSTLHPLLPSRLPTPRSLVETSLQYSVPKKEGIPALHIFFFQVSQAFEPLAPGFWVITLGKQPKVWFNDNEQRALEKGQDAERVFPPDYGITLLVKAVKEGEGTKIEWIKTGKKQTKTVQHGYEKRTEVLPFWTNEIKTLPSS